MIHRLDHPLRALCAGILTFWLLPVALSGFGAFGIGYPELAIMLLLSVAVGLWAGHDRKTPTESG